MRFLSGRQHSSHDRCVELVLTLTHIAVVILYSNYERRKRTFFFEDLLRHRDGQPALQALAISRLVAVTFDVPCEDTNLIEVEGQSVLRLSQNGKILRDFLIAVA